MTKREAKVRAYRWAADVLENVLSAGAILAEDPTEELKMEAALQEVIAGLHLRSQRMESR